MDKEIKDILNEFPDKSETSTGVSDDKIDEVETCLKLKFPADYRSFMKEYGTLQADYIGIYGLSVEEPETLSVSDLTEYLRLTEPDFPENFLPFQESGEERFACLDCSTGQVVIWNCNQPAGNKQETLDESFKKYLNRLLYGWKWWRKGLERLAYHIKNPCFKYDHQDGGQIPRSHLWRPYRFCVQDVVLGITVLRHDSKYNRLMVDVFLTAEIPEYEADSGCRAIALILLSDAYKSGSSMEIKFTGNVENGRVPLELCDMAERLGVNLKHPEEGGITPREAKELYLALSDFRTELRDRVMEMDKSGILSAVSAAYAVHRGVWTTQEIESVILGSKFPDSILKGSFPQETWHLFNNDLVTGRTALMGGYVDRQLVRREHSLQEGQLHEEQAFILELEDNEREVEIAFDPEYCAKVYEIRAGDEEVTIPWLNSTNDAMKLSGNKKLRVLIRAREFEDLKESWQKDLKQAEEIKNSEGENQVCMCIMYPGDFRRLDTEIIDTISEEFINGKIGLMICPDFINQLDQDVLGRLESVKVMRQ